MYHHSRAVHAVSHPELEIRLLESLLPDVDTKDDDRAHEHIFVDLLEVSRDKPKARLRKRLKHDDLVQHFEAEYLSTPASVKPPELRILFVEDPAYADSRLAARQPSTQRPKINKTALWLHRRFGVSLSFFENMSPSSQIRLTGSGSFTKYNEQGQEATLIGFYQNSHGFAADPAHIWFSLGLREPFSSIYVIYNSSEGAKKHILACAKTQNALQLLRPMVVDAFMQEDHLNGWIRRLGEHRTKLLYYEDESVISTYTPAQCVHAVEDLHNIDKQLHVAHGNFLDLKEKVPFILGIRDKYLYLCNPRRGYSAQDVNSVTESMELLLNRGQSGIRWSTNYYERAEIRINLFFNLTTQADSKTNLDIAKLTTKISVTAQRDSASMITMAAVTMFFLPGSFVSALFSMVFFDSGKDERGNSVLSVAPQWWLFPSIAIPLTVLVFAIWLLWRRRRDTAVAKDVARGGGGKSWTIDSEMYSEKRWS